MRELSQRYTSATTGRIPAGALSHTRSSSVRVTPTCVKPSARLTNDTSADANAANADRDNFLHRCRSR